MRERQVISSGVWATSGMTLFSYFLSRLGRENFREPVLLAAFLQEASQGKLARTAVPAGWATHYSLGLVWALVHLLVKNRIKTKSAMRLTLLMGTFSGLTGALVWRQLFELSKRAPKTNQNTFYIQLIAAHIIFSTIVLKLLKE